MFDLTRDELLSMKEDAGLDSFSPEIRKQAFDAYVQKINSGVIPAEAPSDVHNMHCHTFYSYNCFGWSPAHVAIMAKLKGFKYAGKVDFDVLNGVEEFLECAKAVNADAVCGLETRVFIPELADDEINSPGEKGVAYHMGLGFKSEKVPSSQKAFLDELGKRAKNRTATVVERVNKAIPEVALDFEKDVVTLTPAGNPTERHVCSAYRLKALKVTGSEAAALDYWTKALKLSDENRAKAAKSIAGLEGLIRSVLMKSGGPGYIKPDAGSFPKLDDVNAFTKACGAIPCIAWLNGCSSGESDPARLLGFHKSHGAGVLAIIPDRNWNIADPAKKAKCVANLYAVIDAAGKLNMPVIAGTELNSPGNKLVDDFSSDALRPVFPKFVQGIKDVFAMLK